MSSHSKLQNKFKRTPTTIALIMQQQPGSVTTTQRMPVIAVYVWANDIKARNALLSSFRSGSCFYNGVRKIKATYATKVISRHRAESLTIIARCIMTTVLQGRQLSFKASVAVVIHIKYGRQPHWPRKTRIWGTVEDSGRGRSTTDWDSRGEIYERLHLWEEPVHLYVYGTVRTDLNKRVNGFVQARSTETSS